MPNTDPPIDNKTVIDYVKSKAAKEGLVRVLPIGCLGMITPRDVVLAISNSGETAELLTLLPRLKRLGVPLITLTGRPDSTLAREAAATLDISVTSEACPLGLAPTASTTAALAMGDALAIAVLERRGFTADDFARSHPAAASVAVYCCTSAT